VGPGVIASLTPDQKPLADLGWFPFPRSTARSGEPGAMMGGVDGYSCYVDAPKECADFLELPRRRRSRRLRQARSTRRRQQGRQGRRHRPRTCSRSSTRTTTRRTSRCGSTRCSARTSATRSTSAVVDLLAGKGDAQEHRRRGQRRRQKG
jgi:multiple sugar transport system substrate-binding protein/raffinose/stachyose/melibiose transport system substrate-binding protein